MAINRRDLIVRGGATAAALTAGGAAAPAAAQTGIPTKWDHTADVVVIGGGATGIPAAIAAREAGSSVILVETQPHVGGHARVSGGNVPLGGGTSVQKKYGIEDFARSGVQGSHRLVGGAAERRARLPLQRS